MPARMVKLVNDVVTEAMVSSNVAQFNADGWIDVSTKFYQGQPVSIGWLYDSLTDSFTPPPTPQQLPA